MSSLSAQSFHMPKQAARKSPWKCFCKLIFSNCFSVQQDKSGRKVLQVCQDPVPDDSYNFPSPLYLRSQVLSALWVVLSSPFSLISSKLVHPTEEGILDWRGLCDVGGHHGAFFPSRVVSNPSTEHSWEFLYASFCDTHTVPHFLLFCLTVI